jgi:sugar (pentulose or hexulose) kinase
MYIRGAISLGATSIHPSYPYPHPSIYIHTYIHTYTHQYSHGYNQGKEGGNTSHLITLYVLILDLHRHFFFFIDPLLNIHVANSRNEISDIAVISSPLLLLPEREWDRSRRERGRGRRRVLKSSQTRGQHMRLSLSSAVSDLYIIYYIIHTYMHKRRQEVRAGGACLSIVL